MAVVLVLMVAVYLVKLAVYEPAPEAPATACTTFQSGQGGGYICEHR